jgi:putative tryptophan/tyrosine transport system substrate-binding protein
MKRRDLITLLGGAATAWPIAARAQQLERMRRIGVLASGTEGDPVSQAQVAALRDGLAKVGWVEARNLRIDLRFGGGDAGRIRALAAELVSLAPDVIVSSGVEATLALQRQTQTIPIVITGVGDPVDNGIVKSIARPEGNTTGVTNLFSSIGGKWLELLKEAAPRVERVALIYNAQVVQNVGFFPSIEEAARRLAVTAIRTPYRDAVDLVRGIDAFASEPNGGLIILPPRPADANRGAILRLAAQPRIPTIYQDRAFPVEGGLMAYGSNTDDNFRRVSYFVDRIFRGAKVGELPIEYPTKFGLVINLKTAKAIGLTIPEAFLLRADKLIE